MKKMKGIVPMEHASYEDQRTRFRYQSLLQDYEELQKETEAMRRKFQVVKQEKSMLSAEVRFLRQRYRYLMKNPSPKPQSKQDVPKPQKLEIKALTIPKPKGRKYNKKELALRPPVAPHSNLKERTCNVVDVSSRKSAHVFDLNQNARSFTGKEATFLSSAPLLDLNQKERTHIGKEAAKKSIIPSFDLNQISREEEELLGNNESFRMEEPKRNTQRSVIEEQHNDIKLSVCRNVGDGSNRTGKRKISWQDQVALRV
ncbi:hypothetical protein L6164_011528 [Bauhinia variegata]|uniref:Uncharacterized protein n=1 Tax=Bauhinia variegata TaxID=167791 RepID=A0ACB9P8D9_BAUVA|nr:hypothetical protein L6164_011528 [Bauhinia variegata]